MPIKILKALFLSLSIIVLQIAAVPNLPSIFSNLNLFLVFLIFFCVVFNFGSGLAYGFFWAFVLDLYSPYPFGSYIAGTMVTLFVVYRIFALFLTNKSYYSLLVLTLLATAVFCLCNLIFLDLNIFFTTKDFALIQSESLAFLFNTLWQAALNLGLASVLFLFLHQFSRRFNAVFIDTIKN